MYASISSHTKTHTRQREGEREGELKRAGARTADGEDGANDVGADDDSRDNGMTADPLLECLFSAELSHIRIQQIPGELEGK